MKVELDIEDDLYTYFNLWKGVIEAAGGPKRSFPEFLVMLAAMGEMALSRAFVSSEEEMRTIMLMVALEPPERAGELMQLMLRSRFAAAGVEIDRMKKRIGYRTKGAK